MKKPEKVYCIACLGTGKVGEVKDQEECLFCNGKGYVALKY